jgi:hypothetical protein
VKKDEWPHPIGLTKNKSSKSDNFLAPKNHHPKTSIPPSIHHNFTRKLPHEKTHILQNPLQKRPQIGQIWPIATPTFFPQKAKILPPVNRE